MEVIPAETSLLSAKYLLPSAPHIVQVACLACLACSTLDVVASSFRSAPVEFFSKDWLETHGCCA